MREGMVGEQWPTSLDDLRIHVPDLYAGVRYKFGHSSTSLADRRTASLGVGSTFPRDLSRPCRCERRTIGIALHEIYTVDWESLERDANAIHMADHGMRGRQDFAGPMPVACAEQFGTTRVVALAAVSTSAWLSVTLLPYEVSTFSVGYHLGPVRAGWITAAELLALACAASYVGYSIAIRDKRRLTILGIAIAAGAATGCLLTDHLVVIIGFRLLFGVGTGIVAAATNALPALHQSPKKLFAYMQLALGVVFGLAIFVFGGCTVLRRPRGCLYRRSHLPASPRACGLAAPERSPFRPCFVEHAHKGETPRGRSELARGTRSHVDRTRCTLGFCRHGRHRSWVGR